MRGSVKDERALAQRRQPAYVYCLGAEERERQILHVGRSSVIDALHVDVAAEALEVPGAGDEVRPSTGDSRDRGHADRDQWLLEP